MPSEPLIPFETTDLTGARILALAAHPDDETLGAGGVLALNAGRAQAVRVWIATDGTGQEGVAETQAAEYGSRRREEASRAASILGVDAPVYGALRDGALGEDRAALKAAVRDVLEEFRPDLVLCPAPSELHADHRALARCLYEIVASSRAGDSDHDWLRFVRIAFYELSHPLLPNALVDVSSVAEKKEDALAAFASQQAVRDYAGAMRGLNTYRRLTLGGHGPVEAFRLVTWAEASTTSFEDLRRRIGPSTVADGSRGPAPVSVVIRTRNRPALLREALESLAAQTARPRQVVVVNDGGASPREVTDAFRSAFDVVVEEARTRRGRSDAANRGVAAAREELVAFLDDDDRCFPDHVERLARAQREGPGAGRLLRRGDRGLRARRLGMGAARADAPVLARLRPGLPRLRELHSDPHASASARAVPEGRRVRRGARVLGGLGLPDPIVRRDSVSPRPRGHLRVPRLRGAVERAHARRRGRGGVPGRASKDLRALRGAPYRRGPGPRARPDAGADRRLVRAGRHLAGRAAVPPRVHAPARAIRSRVSRRSTRPSGRGSPPRTSCSTAVSRRCSRRTRSTTTSSRRRTWRSSA